MNYRKAVYIFTKYLISHTFPTNMYTVLYYVSKKTEETYHFQYKYVFYDQEHIRWISNIHYNYTTRKLNFWSWNKTAYITM